MHKIRLAAAWEFDASSRTYKRRFHWVAKLMPREQVWLCFGQAPSDGQVLLNDKQLGQLEESNSSQRFEVTKLLEKSNLLVLSFTKSDNGQASTDWMAHVRLEVVEELLED